MNRGIGKVNNRDPAGPRGGGGVERSDRGGDVLDRAALRSLAAEVGLGHARDLLERLARGGMRLETRDGPATTGSSKIGGLPDLAPGVGWPAREGTRSVFLAQVAADDLPPELPPPAREPSPPRLVSFFVFQDPTTDEVTGGAVEPAPAGDPLQRVAGPGLDAAVLEERRVSLRPVLSLPGLGSIEARTIRRLGLQDQDRDAYLRLVALLEEAQGIEPPRHELLGHPDRIGDDILQEAALMDAWADGREPPSAEELEVEAQGWRVLLRFDSDRSIRWPSGGTAYLCIPADALAAGRYDRVRALTWAPPAG